MMMPANFSAIAESEMTYVVGGASLIDALGAVTAPIWKKPATASQAVRSSALHWPAPS